MAKKSRKAITSHRVIRFLKHIPMRDYWQINKLSLFLKVNEYTTLSYARLDKLYEIASALEKRKITGSFVECGVWNGGSAGVISSVSEKFNSRRPIWLFDSFQGLPRPTGYDVNQSGELGKKGMALGSVEKVNELLFKKLKLEKESIHIVEGWFEETIPKYKQDIGKIALLHLDCDWYKSVKFCLEQLYYSVLNGGFIIIDDYGYWKGCKKAVDEFFQQRNLNMSNIIKTDYTGVYFSVVHAHGE